MTNRNFQSFEANQSPDQTANYSNAGYAGSFYDPNAYAPPDPIYDATGGSEFDNEPPLLEGKRNKVNIRTERVDEWIILFIFSFGFSNRIGH